MDVAALNGGHIAYRHRPGLGRTIVFANSLGSDQSIWDKVIAALRANHALKLAKRTFAELDESD